MKLKEYNDGKASKLAILRMKGHVSLWYEKLKRNREMKCKFKIKTWSKLKKHMKKRFLSSSYKLENHLKITSLSQEDLKVEKYISEFE